MTIPIYTVDAFTSQPFRGNPAAVCLLDQPAAEPWMQAVAAEMNLSETAFVMRSSPPGSFDLRWFTPLTEVALCGHATLAAAHVLWESGRLRPDEAARFQTRSGELTCIRRDAWIEMDFPATPVDPVDAPPDLFASLGVFPVAGCWRSDADYLLELPSEDAVRAVRPDFARLACVPTRGVIITSRSADPAYDFVSRFFAPAVGINEDPVTGSAHCALAVHWSRILGREAFVARQLSSRGGVVRVGLRNGGRRVALGGRAITIVRGELLHV
jgi:predicted PhzF superfamily epimerase YddE/YHI9